MSDEKVTPTEINRGTTKRLIMDILIHTGNLDSNGGKEERASIPKEFFRGFRELKKQLFDSLEYGVVKIPLDENGKERSDLIDAKFDLNDLEWLSFKKNQGQKIPPKGYKVIAERYIEGPIQVSPASVKSLKHFYDERTELIDVEVEALDELEGLLGLAK